MIKDNTDEAASPEACGAPAHPAEYEHLISDENYSVRVPEFTDQTRMLAAKAIAESIVGGGADETPVSTAWLAGKATSVRLSKHVDKQPEDVGCYCDDEGWWCEEGDSPRVDFWQFSRSDLSEYERRGEAELDGMSPVETVTKQYQVRHKDDPETDQLDDIGDAVQWADSHADTTVFERTVTTTVVKTEWTEVSG